jgi:hypothetical protein
MPIGSSKPYVAILSIFRHDTSFNSRQDENSADFPAHGKTKTLNPPISRFFLISLENMGYAILSFYPFFKYSDINSVHDLHAT